MDMGDFPNLLREQLLRLELRSMTREALEDLVVNLAKGQDQIAERVSRIAAKVDALAP